MTREEEAKMWEHISGYPAGSYIGSHCGTPLFEVKELPQVYTSAYSIGCYIKSISGVAMSVLHVYGPDGTELKGEPDGAGGLIFKDKL